MCRMEKWFEDADWIRLTQDKVRWWAFFVYGSEWNFGFHKSRENCSGSENEWRRPTWVKYGQMHPSLSTLYISFPAPWRGRGIAPRVLNLGSRWRWVVAITICYRKTTGDWVGLRASLDVREKRKTFPLLGFEPRTVQPVTQSLNRLLEQVTVLLKKKHNDQTEEQQNPVST